MRYAVTCVFLLATLCVAFASKDSDNKNSKPKSGKGELLALIDPLEVSAQSSSPAGSLLARAVSAVASVAPLASASLLADDYTCSAKCNRKAFDSNETESGCWGTFTWFCKSNNASSHTVMAVKCEGHYSLYTDKDAGKALAVCEGLHKYFNVRTTTCPASGARYSKFMSAGCFGTGASKMLAAPSARGAAAAVVADMAAYASGATAAPFAAGGGVGVVLAGQSGQDEQPAAGHHMLMGAQGVGRVESGKGFAYEGKCGGIGWEVKGVSNKASAAEPIYSDADEVEAGVDAALAALGLPPKLINVGESPAVVLTQDKQVADASQVKVQSKPPSLEPPDNSLLKALLPAVAGKVDLGDGRHLTCNLTCNGDAPWLDGALPCWGSLLLRCEGRRNAQEDFTHKLTKLEVKEAEAAAREAKWVKEKKKKAFAAAKKKADELRKKEAKNQGKAVASDLPLSRTAFAAVHGRRAMVTRRQRRALLAAVQRYTFAAGLERTELSSPSASFEFDATCKGFWTGWFGKRCYGLTQTHGAFVSDVKDVEVWGLCTGKHGVAAKKGKEGYAMGSWCKGHSAKGVVAEWHSTSEEPRVQDLHLDMQEVKAVLPDGGAVDADVDVATEMQTAASGVAGGAEFSVADVAGVAGGAQATVSGEAASGSGVAPFEGAVAAEDVVVHSAVADVEQATVAATEAIAEAVEGPRL